MMASDERSEELEAIQAIFPEFSLSKDRSGGSIAIPVKPATPLLVRFAPDVDQLDDRPRVQAYVEHDVHFDALPPLTLGIELPQDYPDLAAPAVNIICEHDWLPDLVKAELCADASRLWYEYGHTQCVFAYIDHVQTRAEAGFDLGQNGCLTLAAGFEAPLVRHQLATHRADFEKGTYDCSVCLEPKKGTACYKMEVCGHVFCKKCLQDFYNNAIDEGDIAVVRCLDPDCGKDNRTKRSPLHPRELLAMDIDESRVRRYLEMKRKKRLESDKTTVYCPRSWCQGAARSSRYPPIPKDLTLYVEAPDVPDDQGSDHQVQDEDERLSICEKCSFAFCRTCYASWHGSFVRCRPRDPDELTAEEKASYDYIRLHTSPCPTCSSPTQKTMGCNHMHCFQCRTHFCYLCGAWLDGTNPYEHFNTPGTGCYQRLWELEEGDNGQAPADGRGFAGARALEALEALAIEDNNAANAAPAQAQQQVAAPVPNRQPIDHIVPPDGAGDVQRPPARNNVRLVNGLPQVRPQQPVQLVANDLDRRQPALAPRHQAELRRFIELAARDEEDQWDSDEFSEDDDGWQIR